MSKQVQQIQQHPAGYVGHDSGGHFVHYCHCGKWAAFGYGMRKGHLGQWFCGDHRQEGPVPVIVTLSEVWRNRAIEAGKARNAAAVARNAKPYGGGVPDSVDFHINGALAEVAVAKHFRLPWQVGTVGGIDVGGKIEVRSRPIPGPGTDIGIRPHDRDDLPYVLVHVHADSTIKLIGWLYGRDGKHRPELWNEASKCWFVPPPYRPISELIGIIRP